MAQANDIDQRAHVERSYAHRGFQKVCLCNALDGLRWQEELLQASTVVECERAVNSWDMEDLGHWGMMAGAPPGGIIM